MSRVCACCGAPARPAFRVPPADTSPDLDMRPGEPARSTLPRWISVCPGCGAAAPDLAVLPDGTAETVRGDEYRRIGETAPAYAVPFLRWALICREAVVWEQAAEAMLHAAWGADDAGADVLAAAWRREASDLFADPQSYGQGLARIDVQRRAALFDAAIETCDRLERWGIDADTARIIAFQRERIAARDVGRHLLSSALRPPARSPHVAHGKPAAPGFFGRLFGR